MNQSTRLKGICFAAFSAFLLGLGPMMCKIAYQTGGNPLTVTFLRTAIAMPMLLALLKIKGVSLRLPSSCLRSVILAALIGGSVSGLLLNMSFLYISSGLATTLRFVYPALTALGGWIFFKERLHPLGWAALAAVTLGIALFSHDTLAVLALLSGTGYAFYILFFTHSGLKGQNPLLLTFYFCSVITVSTGILGLLTGGFSFSMTPSGWGIIFLASLCNSIGGTLLFQIGMRLAGPADASILSALEPITSVLCGTLFFRETLNAMEGIGCLTVFAGLFLLLYDQNNRSNRSGRSGSGNSASFS